MKVLVNPNDVVTLTELNDEQVYGVADRSETEFEVASPLFWVDVSDSIAHKDIYYDPSDSTVKVRVRPELDPGPDTTL